jgi:CheY-like chemotaxis protein
VQCEVVPDGVEAVQRASEQAFEVIFMDLNMPRMDGLEATRQLRARGLTLPIIAVTARVSSEDEQECLKAGMTAYLTKPVSLKRLEELVFQTLPRLRFAQG